MSESRTAETSASLERNLGRLSSKVSDTKLPLNSALQEKDTEAQDSDDSETLKRVQGKIPKEAWLIASFSGAERFAYFALSAPLRTCRFGGQLSVLRYPEAKLVLLQRTTFRTLETTVLGQALLKRVSQ